MFLAGRLPVARSFDSVALRRLCAAIVCVAAAAGLWAVPSPAADEQDQTTPTESRAFPTSGTITASQIGDGVWWRPELDETSISLMLATLQEQDIRNLYVDVFRSGQTLYPSSLMPQRPDAAERDWFAYIIEQAHEHDIRVHAWMQVLCWQDPEEPTFNRTAVLDANPTWLDVTEDGVAFDGKTMARHVHPGVAEVRSVLLHLADEICGYPVDGFSMDALEYNHRVDMGYNPAVTRQFRLETGIDAATAKRDLDDDSDWMQWVTFREDQLTSLVQLMAARARRTGDADNRRVVVSANIYPGYAKSRGLNRRYQNWPQWIEQDILDFTLAECFSPDPTDLEKQLWDVRSAHMGSSVACVPGLQLGRDPGNITNHPTLEDQVTMLGTVGFRHCNIMDYSAFELELNQAQSIGPDEESGFWKTLLSKLSSRD